VHLSGDLNGKRIAIPGSGPIGMSALLSAKAAKAFELPADHRDGVIKAVADVG
jgi:hypothetical protein